MAEPNIRDIQPADLRSTERLLELHSQAVKLRLAGGGEAGQLDFFAMAHRARTRAQRPGAFFYWLLRENKTAFITAADEDAAVQRLRDHRNGAQSGSHESGNGAIPVRRLSADEELVERCIRVARQHRIADPYRVAQKVLRWSSDRWETAMMSYTATQTRHWVANDPSLQSCC